MIFRFLIRLLSQTIHSTQSLYPEIHMSLLENTNLTQPIDLIIKLLLLFSLYNGNILCVVLYIFYYHNHSFCIN